MAEQNFIRPHLSSRTPSVTSARTESSDDSLAGTLAALTGTTRGDSEHVPRSSMSDSGRSVRASCPESLLLQRNHSQRRRGRKIHHHFETSFTRPESDNSWRRKSSTMSIDDPLDVLNDVHRFAQENYECSFCSSGEPTFQKLLHHISVSHPWYDLTMHRNIR
ncbi:hypothetical protein IWW56_005924 [Coemansia sp. RSA 2131]|nr:hypothetical protein IWW56_005924 [Coemansia sp. RSA 2131]